MDDAASPTSAAEICGDGIDNNCNGQVDEGCGCDAGGQDCCAKSFGQPVDATSGTTSVDDQLDIRVSTPGVPLVFTRRYVQQNTNYPLPTTTMTDRMVLGPGWSHTYDVQVRVINSTTIMTSGGAGPDLLLKNDGTGTYRAGASGVVAKLTGGTPSGWVVHYPDGTRAAFDSARRLLYIADRGDRGVRVMRNSDNKVDTVRYYENVVGPTGEGPFLKLNYIATGNTKGMLASVAINNQGTPWTYNYLQIGTGSAVSSPWSPILSSVTDQLGRTRLYEYRAFPPTVPGAPETYALTRVIDESGSIRSLDEFHLYDAGAPRTIRTVSKEGDFAFQYESTTRTNIYSSPLPGGFCTVQGSCQTGTQTGTCEGTCVDPSNAFGSGRACTANGNCPSTGSCSFGFGRCTAYCASHGDCGTGLFCAPDANVAALAFGKSGRCYAKKEVVHYDAATKSAKRTEGCTSCSVAGSGDRYYEWNADGTLKYSKDDFGGGNYRFQGYQYDTKKRITNLTTNNNSSTDLTCSGGTPEEPCLRQSLTYDPSSEPSHQTLVQDDKRSPALPGGTFGDRYEHSIYNTAGQRTQLQRIGKTRDVKGITVTPPPYTTVFGYTNGRLVSIDPPDTPAQAGKDNTIALTYWDADGTGKSGQLETVTRHVPGGATATQTTTFESYNDLGQPTKIVGADGVTVALGYDALGRLISMTRGSETTEYKHDLLGRLSRVKLPGGTQCVHYLYSEGGFGELTTIVIADSCPASGSATTADGNYAELTYDGNHRVTGIAFYTPGTPGKKVFEQTVEYDVRTGKISRRNDKGIDTSRYKRFLYDAFGRLTDAGGELCSDPNVCGAAFPNCTCPRTALTNNALGQVLTLSRKLESGTLDTTFKYDNAAQVNKVVTAPTASSTATTSYIYDDFGRVVEVSSPDSGITRYEYDGNDNVIKRLVAAGTTDEITTTYDYDGANRLIAIKHGDYTSHCKTLWTGQDVKLHYDSHTDCSTGVCKNDCPTGMCQNGATRLVMAEVEVGCTGFLAGTPLWQQHWYSYDAQGRVVGEIYRWPVGTTHVDVAVGYQYDTAGNLKEVKLPTGSRIIYTRGGNGPSDAQQVTKVQYDWLGTGPVDIATDVSYQPFGPVASYTLAANCPGTATPIKVDIVRDTAYLVDDVKTSCLGLLRRDVQTDVPPRAASITDPSPRTCSSSSGCLLGDSCDFGVCKTSLHNSYYGYDYASRLTCDATTSTTCLETASTTKTAAVYSGENVSRLTYRNGYTSGQTLDFQYSAGSNRLTSASSGGGQTIAYASDNAGRRISDTEVAHLPKPSPAPQPNLDAAGRYFFYYPSGRQLGLYHQVPVQKGSYDHQFVLSQYDHRGLRIAKQIYILAGGVEPHFYIYDPDGNLLMDIRFLTSGQLEVFEYVNLEGRPVFQRGMSSAGILDMFLVGDHLGRPAVGLWPGLGGAVLWRADADAFGWTRPISFPVYMPHRLPGQLEDTETAVTIFDPANPGKILMLRPPLHYNWHRTYDPMVGMYLEPDPLGQKFDTNPYRYVLHDPVNKIDPTGKFVFVVPIAIGAGDAAAVAGATIAAWLGAKALSEALRRARPWGLNDPKETDFLPKPAPQSPPTPVPVPHPTPFTPIDSECTKIIEVTAPLEDYPEWKDQQCGGPYRTPPREVHICMWMCPNVPGLIKTEGVGSCPSPDHL